LQHIVISITALPPDRPQTQPARQSATS